MSINIKRIIREELTRLTEADVLYPKFGGGHEKFIETLQSIEKTLTDALEETSIRDEEEIAFLDDLLKKVADMLASDSDEDSDEDDYTDEEPFGGEATDSERSELARFNSWARDQY
jgi:hypothetical protein